MPNVTTPLPRMVSHSTFPTLSLAFGIQGILGKLSLPTSCDIPSFPVGLVTKVCCLWYHPMRFPSYCLSLTPLARFLVSSTSE